MELPLPEEVQVSSLSIVESVALKEYGEADASPVALLTKIAWDTGQKMSDRMRAAIALLPYCHTPFRATDMINPNAGPELLVQVLGVVAVPAPGHAFQPQEREINGEASIDTE